jgi:membrane protease YdiL (CAAX protease family)
MKALRSILTRHSLVIGIIMMFLLTWPIDLANAGLMPFQVPFAVYILLGWGFIFAALIMTGLTLGRVAVIRLLKRYLIWRVGWKWYLVAFLLFPAVYISAIILNASLTQSAVDFSTVTAYDIFGPSASLPMLILPFFLFDAIANGEEMGWRGYVLPRLQAKHSALVSSLIIGVIWGFWHLPKYLAPENTGPFPLFMVQKLAEAVLYTWLYNNSKGSLLLVTFFHASDNTTAVFLPVANTRSGSNLDVLIIAIAIEVIVVIVLTLIHGAEHLSRTKSKQVLEEQSIPDPFLDAQLETSTS